MAKNNIWYVVGGVVIFVLVLWIILANVGNDKVVCNHPYIQVGQSCCLDENANNICDSDETTQQNTNTNNQQSSNNEPSCRQEQVPYQEEECSTKDATNYQIEIKEENVHLVNGKIGVSIYVKEDYQDLFSVNYQVFCDGDYSSDATFTDNFGAMNGYDGSFFMGDTFDASITSLTNCYIEVIDAEYRDCEMVTKYKTETVCD